MTAADELLLDTPAARPCLHPRAKHQHGTAQAYKRDGCRCTACRTAYAAEVSTPDPAPQYGRWSTWIDAAPVRAHVEDIMRETGIGWRSVAARAGLTPATVRKLLYGLQNDPPSRRLNRRTAEALYAIPAGSKPSPRPSLWGGDP